MSDRAAARRRTGRRDASIWFSTLSKRDSARDSLVALLRSSASVASPATQGPVSRQSISATESRTERRAGISAVSIAWKRSRRRPTARIGGRRSIAALAVARELAPLSSRPRPASRQIARAVGVSATLRTFEPLDSSDSDSPHASEAAVRAALIEILRRLTAAHARASRRAVDDRRSGLGRPALDRRGDLSRSSAATGVHLVDDQAARYGDFDDMTIVGLIENEWPDRPRRNIFYPPGAAESARLAVGERSTRGGRCAVPRSARFVVVTTWRCPRSRSTTRRS